ncbi:NAD(P)H-dependent oxidoreductase [Komagataeibacter intermedius]|uniref:NAD(P)H dehydrogenase n=2 Tax=Komagataeibacter intermedius TaxID=66229 RepID=A0A0N0MDV1_9PROT|nr:MULTISPECIES: NAD(P)H-dependent oxidoreductase [Komagataeibacter]KPH85716.1 NAD(P)H dehydrogenase [Komagataeibacter intermedius AF2]MBV0888733.1 NAD(P)H-dependent oxidoreductase [Komagataeibacter oboediens]MCF3637436.1 NAD(P)H-dependent oxidoreductase [Komagataeibacter intermedius]MCK9821258.1 NAD(P)H-dependent oxidoreductase [Komagataeibacter oboediens]WEQ51662.1 NAD(P)H-dependent oxidoreductase [Komagataeibacter oboediens]
MKVHVIYAHPLTDSFNAALHELAVRSLKQAGHEVDDLDLYRENFNPVLSAEDREIYHDPAINQKHVANYVRRLQTAEALVLCHPVWNFGWPAILKGYFDRVFLPDVSFKLIDGVLSPGFSNIRRVSTITTYGSPRHRAFILGDPPRKNGTRFLRAVMNRRVKVDYLALYNMNNTTLAARDRFMGRVRDTMLSY